MRLRLSRARGFDLQRLSKRVNNWEAVNVARPGRWGNPFRVGPDFAAKQTVAKFREALLAGTLPFGISDVKALLAGRNLACWCAPGAPCHADVLLEIASTEQRR